jgi:hypothetical protein
VAARRITWTIYSLAAAAVVVAAASLVREWLTDYWLVAKFRPTPGCEVRVWRGEFHEPDIICFYYELQVQGRVEIQKTEFAASDRSDFLFRAVTAPGCADFGISCYPETNRVLVVLSVETGLSGSRQRGSIDRLQQCLPGRPLIHDASGRLPSQGLASFTHETSPTSRPRIPPK